ncbi:MAG: hypothetical protein QXO39_06595 [Conexivisphaerales archaeon]
MIAPWSKIDYRNDMPEGKCMDLLQNDNAEQVIRVRNRHDDLYKEL